MPRPQNNKEIQHKKGGKEKIIKRCKSWSRKGSFCWVKKRVRRTAKNEMAPPSVPPLKHSMSIESMRSALEAHSWSHTWLCSVVRHCWWTFRPLKRMFSPASPPKKKFPNSPPSRPSAPPPSWKPPPPGIFINPPPRLAPRTPPSPRAEKKIKNIRNVHQALFLCGLAAAPDSSTPPWGVANLVVSPKLVVCNFHPEAWAVTWGGAKRMGGGKRTRKSALPKIFGPLQKSFWSTLSCIFVQAKQSTDTWGGWKTRGWSKTPFWEGCHSWGFHPPPFSNPPPMASSEKRPCALFCGLAFALFCAHRVSASDRV